MLRFDCKQNLVFSLLRLGRLLLLLCSKHLLVNLLEIYVLILDGLPDTLLVEDKQRLAHGVRGVPLQESFAEPDVETRVVLGLELIALLSQTVHSGIVAESCKHHLQHCHHIYN